MASLYYQDDHVTIFLGDSREILPEVEADVMVTDPPYGIAHRSGWSSSLFGSVATAYQSESGDAIHGDADTSLRDGVLSVWGERPALIFGSHRESFPAGYRAVLVWDKGENAGMGDLSIPWKPNWELIFVLGSGFSGSRTTGVLRGYIPGRVSMGRQHPNEKPVDLMRGLILKCPPGVVLDPFMGSGTTLRAAKDLGRKAIGIEINERYCEIAAKRCAQEVLF